MIGDSLIQAALTAKITHAMAMEQFIKAVVNAALAHSDGNIAAAGRSLGINRTTLDMMLRNDRPFVKCYRQKR